MALKIWIFIEFDNIQRLTKQTTKFQKYSSEDEGVMKNILYTSITHCMCTDRFPDGLLRQLQKVTSALKNMDFIESTLWTVICM